MSMPAYRWAKTWTDISSPQKFVLLMIADHYNDTEKRSWPSIETLARETSLNPRTVSRALRELEALELIETESWISSGTGKQMSNRYCLPFYDDSFPCRGRVRVDSRWAVSPTDPRQSVQRTPGTESNGTPGTESKELQTTTLTPTLTPSLSRYAAQTGVAA